MTPRIAPTFFYSLEEETDSLPNLHQLPPAPNLPVGPTHFQPPAKTPSNNVNHRQHWENVLLKYEQQTEIALQKNLQQEQAYQQLKQQMQDTQRPHPNFAINYDGMMPQQNQLEQHPPNHTLAALKDERDKVIADNKRLTNKIDLLITREQDLMGILGTRNVDNKTQRQEIEKIKENLSSMKENECRKGNLIFFINQISFLSSTGVGMHPCNHPWIILSLYFGGGEIIFLWLGIKEVD